MAAPAAPDEGMTMGVPIGRGGDDGRLELVPGLEAFAFEGERAQGLPPRFDQVEVGGVLGLEDELPARMGQGEEQHIERTVGAEVVEHRIDAFSIGRQPRLDLRQEVHPVRNCAPTVWGGERRARGRDEGTEDVATTTPAIVDLLSGAGSAVVGRARPHGTTAGETLGGFGSHLVEADDDTLRRWLAVELNDGPLFWANSGSTRSPNQVSWVRQRMPSAIRISSTRLRFIVTCFCSARYATNRSSVQQANGSARSAGLARTAAISALTSSGVYVFGAPARGASAKPATPRAAKRVSQRRTVGSQRCNSV